MSEMSKKTEILRKYSELVNIGQIDQIKITYRVGGGPPGKLLYEEMMFLGNNDVRLIRKDEITPDFTLEGSLKLDPAETHILFSQIGRGFDNFDMSSTPIFLPDSVVSSFTIEFEDNKAAIYFLSNEVDRAVQNKAISPEIAEAHASVERISQRIIEKSHG
jgi:hypothetical protein